MENGVDKSAASAVQANRVLTLKRAYQRQLGRKPTVHEKSLLDRAAVLTARAEVAALDPATTTNDIVPLDGCRQQGACVDVPELRSEA